MPSLEWFVLAVEPVPATVAGTAVKLGRLLTKLSMHAFCSPGKELTRCQCLNPGRRANAAFLQDVWRSWFSTSCQHTHLHVELLADSHTPKVQDRTPRATLQGSDSRVTACTVTVHKAGAWQSRSTSRCVACS